MAPTDTLISFEQLFKCMKIDDRHLFEGLGLFFKTLGDPTRLRILYALESGEMCVNCICDTLHMSPSAVSHQLRILKDRDLIRSRRDGKSVIYSISDEHVHDIISKAYEHLIE